MPERDVGQVHTDERSRVAARELFGHRAAPVASMRGEALVAEHLGHQRVPQIANVEDRTRLRRLVGEAETGKAWRDDVERVTAGSRAVRLGMRQHRDDLREAQE